MSRVLVKSLIIRANPVPTPPPDLLSGRAAAELADLVGEQQSAEFRPQPPAPGRRGPVLAVAVALSVILVVGVVGLVLFFSDDRRGQRTPVVTDEPYYASTEELVAEADLIVRGRIDATHRQTMDDLPEIRAEVTVLASVGDTVAVGDTIDVAYVIRGAAPSTADVAEGGEYVLLLKDWGDGRRTLVNSTQGSYTVAEGRAIAGQHNEVGLGGELLAELGLGE
ncbi:hypothetical protein [Actinoalloteichus hymeniacidonis]|uniref:hypothetical protein n=1 Tax=Actinoalloteichus hymeniacidonis TaxID=340345 RepID=UPI000853DA50|nr:hypothetical protein [Actinoalloteichus hymeniacidonis]MBB5909954.1 hypothetical protein [Actinoalloteichus hymeniacidonis]